ncbi:MAG TPA: magnesium transporter [Myxococcota bacterium]|nr:magnesium transporter [Myxococcota bacterium]
MTRDRNTWEELLAAAESRDAALLDALLDQLDEPERVHALARLDAEERGIVLNALTRTRAAELLEQIPDSHAAEAVKELEPGAAAEILHELQSDDRAELVAQLDSSEAEAILTASAPEAAQSIRAILQYPEDSAGRLMITEFVAVPATWTARELVTHLQDNVDRYANYVAQYVYALGESGELVGVLPLRNLVLAHPNQSVSALMLRDPISVHADLELQQIFELFDRHRFVGIPVVDASHRMIGVLLREDVDEERVYQAHADQLKSRGVVGGEELRTMPLLTRSNRRLGWLSLNILLNIAAASVIALYQDTLAAAIALAVFLPIISDMSGCSGNQAVAVSLRELALGVVRPSELLRVWWKEVWLGCINGAALGLLIGAVAWLWKGSAALGAVVGLALALNTVVAVSIGGTVPLALRRLGFDPALASGPILTTVTDMFGFFFVLSFATYALPQISGL